MAETVQIEQIHRSVLLNETMEFLAPRSEGTYVDGTLGLGGHTLEILKQSKPDGRVIAFEWDEAAIELATRRLADYQSRLTIIRKNFAEIKEGLNGLNIQMVDGILVDIGLSSLQLDQGKRGFSFREDELLDMRMDKRKEVTAAEILENSSEQELADLFYYYGDEKQARPIAREVVQERSRKKIVTTKQLVAIIARSVPRRFHPKKKHVATKVFQALRIAVNAELENLASFLTDAVSFLKPGARLCVISFHSLEDRLVKRSFRTNKKLKIITQKPIVPSKEEIDINIRARSARLRVAERCEAGQKGGI